MPVANRPARALRCALALVLGAVVAPSALTHLMVAQRGTLNLVGEGAFMVLSVPVSAFEAVDDDGDGELSTAEFEAHCEALAEAVVESARLFDAQGACPLQGLMLTPSLSDHDASGSVTRLVAMGRFALADPAGTIRFETDLFGAAEVEDALQVTATRRVTGERATVTLTPSTAGRVLFAP